MTDYKTVKAWFQQCRDGAAAVKAQKQKIQRIRDAAEKCTQSLNGMPTGGSSGDKVGGAVARLDAEERELKQMEQRLLRVHWRYDVEGLLRKLEGENDRNAGSKTD